MKNFVDGSRRVQVLSRPLLGLGICLLSSGCVLAPRDGPHATAITQDASLTYSVDPKQEAASGLDYILVNATNSIADFMNGGSQGQGQEFPPELRRQGSGDVRLQAGDRVSVTIYEAAAGGLFIPAEAGSRSGNFVQIPAQQIDSKGQIVVPYAGVIKASGKLPSQISAEIVSRLSSRAIEPQVVVALDERRSNDVSVLGEVATPLRFSIDPGGNNLLGAIARAGGSRYPDYESYVRVKRGSRTYRADLSTIVAEPQQDIQLASGDVVYVGREPKTYMVFGATPTPGASTSQSSRRFTFDTGTMTLSEAFAKAGGLSDIRANPKTVYLYRNEERSRVERLDPRFTGKGSVVPTVYAFDLSRGDSMFLAQKVLMRDKDIIFVAEPRSVEFLKLLSLARSANGAVIETVNGY